MFEFDISNLKLRNKFRKWCRSGVSILHSWILHSKMVSFTQRIHGNGMFTYITIKISQTQGIYFIHESYGLLFFFNVNQLQSLVKFNSPPLIFYSDTKKKHIYEFTTHTHIHTPIFMAYFTYICLISYGGNVGKYTIIRIIWTSETHPKDIGQPTRTKPTKNLHCPIFHGLKSR